MTFTHKREVRSLLANLSTRRGEGVFCKEQLAVNIKARNRGIMAHTLPQHRTIVEVKNIGIFTANLTEYIGNSHVWSIDVHPIVCTDGTIHEHYIRVGITAHVTIADRTPRTEATL